MQSDSIANLAKAIAEAQKQLKPVKRERKNPFYNSRYADLASVWEALRPFAEQGISITQSPVSGGEPGCVALETQLTHVSGEWIRSTLTLPVMKDDPQGFGSAITYARRYALGCMTGVVTEDDDDGNAASVASPSSRAAVNRAVAKKKIAELRQGVVEQDGADVTTRMPQVSQQLSDAAPPLSDADWELFLDEMGDDPDKTNIGKQLKELLRIPKVADLQGGARIGFIQQFQESCRDAGVPCQDWIK